MFIIIVLHDDDDDGAHQMKAQDKQGCVIP